jgi:hypothetical protein
MVNNEGDLTPAGGLVEEIEGDIFDAPEGAVLIRTLAIAIPP